MRLFISSVIMLAVALLLQGCGRKGPLRLPPPDTQQSGQHAATPVNTPLK